MSLIYQLPVPRPVETPAGRRGLAHFLLDYGPEYDTLLCVALDDTRELWWLKMSEVRVQHNYSMGRPGAVTPHAPEEGDDGNAE